jgi:hypothetical protein
VLEGDEVNSLRKARQYLMDAGFVRPKTQDYNTFSL